MNTWELCPKCKGEKKVWKNFGSVTTTTDDFMDTIDCSICDGKGIISSLTGLPPQSKNNHWDKVDFSKEVEDLIHK